MTPASGKTSGQESLTDIRASAMDNNSAAASKKRKSLNSLNGTLISHHPTDGKIIRNVLSASQALLINRSRIESIVARYEPLDAELCPFRQAASIQANPAIGRFLPRNVNTVYNEYVVPIDTDSMEQLVKLMKVEPGLLSVSFDGVTVNRKSKVLFTATRGTMSFFYTWIDLGSDVHVTQAEADAAYRICVEVKALFDNLVGITAIPVDNAARGIANLVVQRLMSDGDFPFTLRDPVHCLDLGSKDLVKVICIKLVLGIASDINKFVMGNRVANIIREMVAGGTLSYSRVVKSISD